MKNDLNLKDVIKNSPKTLDKIKGFIKSRFFAFGEIIQKESINLKELKDVDIEFPDINEAVEMFITEDNILNMISFNHRALYDFFDNEKKIISILFDGNFFSYKIYSKEQLIENTNLFTDRLSCENAALTDVIQLIENE
jgi:hypothetical protein